MRKPCCDKQDNNKGAWSKQEDKKLVDYIHENGEGCWRTLPQAAGLLRCGKSCRLRWINYLRPDLKRGNFGEDEEDLIIKLHALLGNRWSLIAGRLPGRTDNEVKNYWNSHLSRKLMKIGVHPNNHCLSKQTLPRPRPPNQHDQSETTEIFRSKLDHTCQPPMQMQTNRQTNSATTNNNNNDQVSDAGSCLEHGHDSCLGLPDLNLDLTIAINNQSHILDQKVHKHNNISRDCRDNHCQPSSPPLLLFS